MSACQQTPGPWAGAAGVSLAVAAGPFTCADDCAYAPLDALLAWAGGARPDVLLLLGPFVDVEHPAVAGGLLEESFEELFAAQVGQQSLGIGYTLGLCNDGALLAGRDRMGIGAGRARRVLPAGARQVRSKLASPCPSHGAAHAGLCVRALSVHMLRRWQACPCGGGAAAPALVTCPALSRLPRRAARRQPTSMSPHPGVRAEQAVLAYPIINLPYQTVTDLEAAPGDCARGGVRGGAGRGRPRGARALAGRRARRRGVPAAAAGAAARRAAQPAVAAQPGHAARQRARRGRRHAGRAQAPRWAGAP